ncbi:MAG: Rieske 2Fe-2S domain-containing protein [Steroidobacteraceae bacterium]
MGELAPAGTVLCALAEIPDGDTKGFRLGDGDWPLRGLLVRNGEAVQGFVNRCPHAGHQLSFRPDKFLTPDKTLILCQSHGALFDKATGRCVGGPCVGEALTPVPVEVVGGVVRLAAEVDVDRLATRYW